MDKLDISSTCWESDDDTTRSDSRMEGNEMSVFVQTHCNENDHQQQDDASSDNINSRKCSFKQHFVEESTLRNIALDELEELSDPGGITGPDGDIRRTSSSVSSEQTPIKYAILIEWDSNYFVKPEGLLRLALLSCSTLSLGCVTNAGTSYIDVLELPVSSYIRAHIFVTVFSILVTSVLFFISITCIIESFPMHWNITDAAIHASLSTLFIFSSSMLLHAEQEHYVKEPPITDWTKVLMSLAAVFGYLSTLCCVFLTVLRSCASPRPRTSEDIILTSIRSS